MKFARPLACERLETRDTPAVVYVTTEADAGAGSLRAAVEAANDNTAVTSIIIRPWVDDITLADSVEYTAGQTLSVVGNGATVRPAAGSEQTFDLFVSSGGADLSLAGLTFQGGQNGVFVPVPLDATGGGSVTLNNVRVLDSGLFGLHIDDQTDDGGSAASVALAVTNSVFVNNGTAELDFDGVRVDEGGEGSIVATLTRTRVDGNGGDGLELDERGAGSVYATIFGSSFDGNGFFNEEDLDDGIDVDEAGAGGVYFSATNTGISGNFDEGLDLNEDEAGDLVFSLVNVKANGNNDEGVKADEIGDGELAASLVAVQANNTVNEEGIALAEVGDGGVSVSMIGVNASGNDKEGIDVAEEDAGGLTAVLLGVRTEGNGDDGAQFEEAGGGSLSVAVLGLASTGNDGYGLKVTQETAGAGDTGWVSIFGGFFADNTDGDTDLDLG